MKIVKYGILAAAVLWAGSASAQTCPDDQAVFVIDQSGSMLSAGATGDPKWEIALEKAQADFALLAPGTVVSIVGFGNTSQGAAGYQTTYVSLSEDMVKGTNDSYLLQKIAAAATPSSSYLTPLAGGACDAIEDVFLSDPTCTFTTARNVYLYSDGLENSTPTSHKCYSAINSSTDFDVSLAGQGFGLTTNSWQWKIANMAWTGNPNLLDLPPVPPPLTAPRPVVNVTLLFDYTNSLALGDGEEGGWGADQQALSNSAVAFFSGLPAATLGSYFESKTINGQATVVPVPGDTDPEPLRSCVEAADYNRVLEAYGRQVVDGDPLFSVEDLAMRDVNNDRVIDILDYYLVINNYGTCAN